MHPASSIRHPASGIIFYGTPVIARASLEAIVNAGFHVSAVVTAPDRPAGRGLKMKASAVKEYALEAGLRVLQPEKLSDPHFQDELRKLDPKLQVVVAFRMMPRSVWSLPPLGTFNLHASLLPQYRGAAPINWAVINGETETGLTTFFLQDKIDTGDIIFRETMPIGPAETAGELHDRMKIAGAALVVKTIRAIFDGSMIIRNQSEFCEPGTSLHPAPKIHSETCRIDWNMPSASIINLIRGLNPVPAAFTEFQLKDGSHLHVKVFNATADEGAASGPPGTLITDQHTYLHVSCIDADICIHQLQPAGRKPMSIAEFLRGAGRNIA